MNDPHLDAAIRVWLREVAVGGIKRVNDEKLRRWLIDYGHNHRILSLRRDFMNGIDVT